MNGYQKSFILIAFISFISSSAFTQTKIIQTPNGPKAIKHQVRAPLFPGGPGHPEINNICPQTPFRSIDGTCNNINHLSRVEYGASDIQLLRIIQATYGAADILNALNDDNRPSPRAISNALCAQSDYTPSERGLSSFVFTWGQFLDHDIDLTPEGESEYAPIELPDDEPLFTEDIPFFRSEVHENTGINTFRQQTNLITSWIDGSNVYGSDEDRAHWLRTFENGKLKTSSGNLLPFNTIDGEYDSEIDPSAPSMAGDNGGISKTFVAGDVRAAEQPGLTAMHTLFVRYHNRICDQLIDQGLQGDEVIYQRARKEVGGVIQAITYNEFLPALGITLSPFNGYRPEIIPNISNTFATAAYRLGHSMVTDELLLRDDQCGEIDEGSISLLEGFFNIEVIRSYNIAPILNGLANQTQNAIDLLIIDNLRNFLFGDPSSPVVFGLDLPSLNIQRGRDHGLPDYNTLRRNYTGRAARRFRGISRNQEIRQALAATYDDINVIDPWVGMLAEDKLPNSSVGRTLHAILKSQFEKLRDGDRFFYQHDLHLSFQEKQKIDQTRLSKVIRAVTNIENIQENVFFAESCDDFTNNGTIQGGGNISSEAMEYQKLEVYPNPAKDYIVVFIDQEFNQPINLSLFDQTGRLIKTVETTQAYTDISILEMHSGVYTISYLSDGGMISQRFVKTE